MSRTNPYLDEMNETFEEFGEFSPETDEFGELPSETTEELGSEWELDWLGQREVPSQPAPSTSSVASMPEGSLGTLTLSVHGRRPFSYQFTPEDALWTARMLTGEAGGRGDLSNQAVVWAMFNRYVFFTHRRFPTFHQFIRAYSTPLQPVLRSPGAARRHMDRPQFVRRAEYYPAPNNMIPMGQLQRHLDLQQTPWHRLPSGARTVAEQAMKGLIANPIGNASEFGSTCVYFHDKYRKYPNDEEWRQFTETFAQKKGWRWIGPMPGLNQRGNAFFVQGSVANLLNNAVRVVLGGITRESPDWESYEGMGEHGEQEEFTPTPVESVGGGRVKDKRPPPPHDLVTVGGHRGRNVKLHRLAADAWRALVEAARADGITSPLLLPLSGFRDPKRQEAIWRVALNRYGSAAEARKWVAPPGSSAHQSGRAIDFNIGLPISSKNATRMRSLSVYRWLVTNAERFGFYPYEREPWHWEYNPPATREFEMLDARSGEWEGSEVFEDEGTGEASENWAAGVCPSCGQPA